MARNQRLFVKTAIGELMRLNPLFKNLPPEPLVANFIASLVLMCVHFATVQFSMVWYGQRKSRKPNVMYYYFFKSFLYSDWIPDDLQQEQTLAHCILYVSEERKKAWIVMRCDEWGLGAITEMFYREECEIYPVAHMHILARKTYDVSFGLSLVT